MLGVVLVIVLLLVCLIASRGKIEQSKKEKRAKEIGDVGESEVSDTIREVIKNGSYDNVRVIDGLMFRDKYENYVQVDHLVITPKKVYVIETKNYNAVVEVSEKDKWSITYPNGKVYEKYSPLKQNKRHTAALWYTFNDVDFDGYVVFLDGATLVGEAKGVYNLKDFKGVFEGILAKSMKGDVDVDKLYEDIMAIDLSDNKRENRKQVKFAKKVASKNK